MSDRRPTPPPSIPPSIRPASTPRRPTGGRARTIAGKDRGSSGGVAVADRPAPAQVERPGPARGLRAGASLVDRLEERRRARRRLRVRAVVGVLTGLALLAGAAWALLASPLTALDVDAVQVRGATALLPEDEVRAEIDAHAGQPLLRIDTARLREQLLALPAAREVSIERDWPDGLRVRLTAREPVASVVVDGEHVLLDGEGVELDRTAEAPEGVPEIGVAVGQDDTAASLDAALTVMDALPPELLERITQVSATSPHQVEFELDDGAQVVWGSAADSALKTEVLTALLQVDASVYDVSAPLAPITR
jgi:cell division protein FtsQ